eukprot:13181485-Alexandrium_andersonii.AAC.1
MWTQKIGVDVDKGERGHRHRQCRQVPGKRRRCRRGLGCQCGPVCGRGPWSVSYTHLTLPTICSV